jgi:hypothetical protein
LPLQVPAHPLPQGFELRVMLGKARASSKHFLRSNIFLPFCPFGLFL